MSFLRGHNSEQHQIVPLLFYFILLFLFARFSTKFLSVAIFSPLSSNPDSWWTEHFQTVAYSGEGAMV